MGTSHELIELPTVRFCRILILNSIFLIQEHAVLLVVLDTKLVLPTKLLELIVSRLSQTV